MRVIHFSSWNVCNQEKDLKKTTLWFFISEDKTLENDFCHFGSYFPKSFLGTIFVRQGDNERVYSKSDDKMKFFFLEIDFWMCLISDPDSEDMYGKGHYQSFADIKQRSKFVYISHDGLAKEYVIFPPKLNLVIVIIIVNIF